MQEPKRILALSKKMLTVCLELDTGRELWNRAPYIDWLSLKM